MVHSLLSPNRMAFLFGADLCIYLTFDLGIYLAFDLGIYLVYDLCILRSSYQAHGITTELSILIDILNRVCGFTIK